MEEGVKLKAFYMLTLYSSICLVRRCIVQRELAQDADSIRLTRNPRLTSFRAKRLANFGRDITFSKSSGNAGLVKNSIIPFLGQFVLKLYEKYTAGLFAEAKKKKRKENRARHVT